MDFALRRLARWLVPIGFLAGAGVACEGASHPDPRPVPRPDVLLITVDTLRAALPDAMTASGIRMKPPWLTDEYASMRTMFV